jgi:hypothetical protein
MAKIKELLFRRFSLFAGLLALASVLVLSYFYYHLQINSPFIYEQAMSHIYEYRVLDSRTYLFSNHEQINFSSARDNLNIQQSLIATLGELFYNLESQGIKTPNSDGIREMEKSIALRKSWLMICSKEDYCSIEEWNNIQAKSKIAGEAMLTSFYNLLWEQEEAWSKNLRIFYMLSIILLLTTLFFAAKPLSSTKP